MMVADGSRKGELTDPASDSARLIVMSYGCPKCRHQEAHIIGSSIVPPLLLTRCPACGFISSHSVV